MTLAWTRTAVERRDSAGLEPSSSSTARISVVFPDPDEPMSRTLPTRRLASFLARATEISRTASGWPRTRLERAAAIFAGVGTAIGGDPTARLYPAPNRAAFSCPALRGRPHAQPRRHRSGTR